MKTVVIFRVWRAAPGTVIALFPKLPADNHGRYCQSYEHVGQHSAADYDLVVRATRPSSAPESAPLKKELEAIGYELDVRRKRVNR